MAGVTDQARCAWGGRGSVSLGSIIRIQHRPLRLAIAPVMPYWDNLLSALGHYSLHGSLVNDKVGAWQPVVSSMNVRAMADQADHQAEARYLRRLGFWLRAARERSGKSQAGVAAYLGLSPSSKSSVSDWENGVRAPRLTHLRALAAYYGLPLEVFTHPEPTPEERLDLLAAGDVEEARPHQPEGGG
jgi:DNA-binding transcriptional regulator YiaG